MDSAKQYVKLNVGGALFQTTLTTLNKYDCMFRAMFSGRNEVCLGQHNWHKTVNFSRFSAIQKDMC